MTLLPDTKITVVSQDLFHEVIVNTEWRIAKPYLAILMGLAGLGKTNYLYVVELQEKLYIFGHWSINYGRKKQHECS